jgi:hypothetical protein
MPPAGGFFLRIDELNSAAHFMAVVTDFISAPLYKIFAKPDQSSNESVVASVHPPLPFDGTGRDKNFSFWCVVVRPSENAARIFPNESAWSSVGLSRKAFDLSMDPKALKIQSLEEPDFEALWRDIAKI